MKIDFSSLAKALDSLGRAIERTLQEPGDEELRDAVIQRFEYTYELCWKMIKRQLESDAAVPAEIDTLSFKALMREAAERGYVESVNTWLIYREQRNITSHTYDARKAQSVYETALEFLPSAKRLLAELEARSSD